MFAILGGFVSAVTFAASDPLNNLKGFTSFQSVELQKLLDGEILNDRASLMNSPDGISAQTCFVVPLPAAEVAKRLQAWDPSHHNTLKVAAFQALRSPCSPDDFQRLNLGPEQFGLGWLLDKTLATTAAKSELNLTHDEARQLATCAKSNSDPQGVGACWADLLRERATAFQDQGFAGVPPYEANGETVSPTAQLRSMLREESSVTHEFAALLRQTGVFGGERTTALKPLQYWGLYEANHRPTLNLGAIYLLPVDDHYQLMDVEYYVSGSYYDAVTLCEIWPIQIGDKTAALVWRGDFCSARTLAFTKGTERMAYGAIMVQEIKKIIRCFQDDLQAKQ